MKIRYYKNKHAFYVWISLPFHKSIEVCFSDLARDISRKRYQKRRFNVYFRLNFAGQDHAGLRIFVGLWRFLFELNVTDSRHWNYEDDTWEIK
jgi:hypothetical protein